MRSLPSKNGWFKLVVRGYKTGATAPVATDEIYLADYRNESNVCLTEWTLFDLTNIKKQAVNRIEFDFVGSDSGAYGLNTTAYKAYILFFIRTPIDLMYGVWSHRRGNVLYRRQFR